MSTANKQTYTTAECVTKSRHELHRRWCNIRNMCDNPRNNNYKYYGGRGIKFCPDWYDFWTFVDDVETEIGPLPYKSAFLDRIDNNGDYEPGNIRWGDPRSNGNNRTSNHKMTAFGRTQTLADWCREYKINLHTLRCRILFYNFTPEQALLGSKK